MTEPLLEIDDLTLALPAEAEREFAIENVSYTLNRGEILCVVGESGSGKSMTANAIMGLLPGGVKPRNGAIRFRGNNLLKLPREQLRDLRGRHIAMIFQEPMTALNPIMKIGEQLTEVFEVHGELDPAGRRQRALQLLDDVGLPEPRQIYDTFPFRLSGGQRQRVMIAMALALEPSILIADEPTTALDVTTQAQILKLIRDLQTKRDMGVLFITHDFGVVAEIADRIVVMQYGKVVEQGKAVDILRQPRHPYTRQLIAAVPSLDPARIHGSESHLPLLRVEALNVIYGGKRLFGRGRTVHAARDVSFDIQRGETFGLVGESGSGKSTVGRSIVRLQGIDSGRILLDGVDMAGLKGAELRRERQRVQMIFQDPYASLNPRMKVGRIIAQGPELHGVDARVARDRALELLRLVGLDERAFNRYPHEFSGGQRQRVGIARALALEPELIVADEAVSALDVSVQGQILELLERIKQELNLAMLFITHDLRVAARICERIAVMSQGKIVEQGPTRAIFARPNHDYTRSLFDAIPGRHWRAAS